MVEKAGEELHQAYEDADERLKRIEENRKKEQHETGLSSDGDNRIDLTYAKQMN